MFKKILVSLIFTSSLFASSCQITPATEAAGSAFTSAKSITFLQPAEAITIAKKTKKPILAIVASQNCPAWQELKKKLNSNKNLNTTIANNFVVVGINGYELEFYPHLATDMSPTIFLLNDDFAQIAQEIKGVPTSEKAFENWLLEFVKWYKTQK